MTSHKTKQKHTHTQETEMYDKNLWKLLMLTGFWVTVRHRFGAIPIVAFFSFDLTKKKIIKFLFSLVSKFEAYAFNQTATATQTTFISRLLWTGDKRTTTTLHMDVSVCVWPLIPFAVQRTRPGQHKFNCSCVSHSLVPVHLKLFDYIFRRHYNFISDFYSFFFPLSFRSLFFMDVFFHNAERKKNGMHCIENMEFCAKNWHQSVEILSNRK